MQILQNHMLRVAAVAAMICDNFDEPLNKDEIVTACLLHDMGNIIKSKFEFMPESLEPEGIQYWQKVKDEYIKKYGSDEYKAHEKIMLELYLPQKIIDLVRNIDSLPLKNIKDGTDFAIKIIKYADMRVSPYGVVSCEERTDEVKKRYKFKTKAEEDEQDRLLVCGKEIEKQIFAKCKIKPEDINDETIAPIVLELKNFVIK